MAGQDDALYADPALVAFYDPDNGWGDDLDACAALARDARSVLDLGCGTGAFLAAIDVPERVGVDPARAMLQVARGRPGGAGATWIEGDARTLRLGRRFDLVVMTGHAFQALLTPDDQRAALATIAAHLGPGGRFVFDTRNPRCREWEEWQPHGSRRRLTHPGHGPVEAWNAATHDPATGIVTYETHYRLADGTVLSASSRIRFTARAELAGMIDEAGLAVDRWLGDWRGAPFSEESKEIIPLGAATGS